MHRRLIALSIPLLLCCLAFRASAQDSTDGPPTGASGSVEALQSALEQFRRDPSSEEARQQLFELLPGKLSQEELDALEARVEHEPHDLAARERLIAYYRSRSFDTSTRQSHNRHLLWLIQNAPDNDLLGRPGSGIQPFLDPHAYTAGKQAWLGHIEREPDNVKFLGNAARFLSDLQDRELVIKFLRTARTLDPDNPEWPYALGGLHLHNRLVGGPTNPAQALEHFRQAYNLAQSDLQRSYFLGNVVEAAFGAERYDDVRSYAAAMLDDSSTFFAAENFHRAHIALGRVALAEGDPELAKYHLLEAGRVPDASSSPGPLRMQGPNMRLASELLKRGEREVVLEYFDLCSSFWHSDRLNEWAAVVRAGGMPDFRFIPWGYRP